MCNCFEQSNAVDTMLYKNTSSPLSLVAVPDSYYNPLSSICLVVMAFNSKLDFNSTIFTVYLCLHGHIRVDVHEDKTGMS